MGGGVNCSSVKERQSGGEQHKPLLREGALWAVTTTSAPGAEGEATAVRRGAAQRSAHPHSERDLGTQRRASDLWQTRRDFHEIRILRKDTEECPCDANV